MDKTYLKYAFNTYCCTILCVLKNDPFIAIEVQLGEITEEDDIVRLD